MFARIKSEMMLVSRTITGQVRRLTDRHSPVPVQVDPCQRRKAPADRFGQVGLTAALWGQRVAQNLAQLGFHRAAVARGSDAQPLLYRRIDVANGQRGHRRPQIAG
jgi:hypothetical protein